MARGKDSVVGTVHACDIMYNAVDVLTLERLKHNSAISCDKLCLAIPGHDHALADVGY